MVKTGQAVPEAVRCASGELGEDLYSRRLFLPLEINYAIAIHCGSPAKHISSNSPVSKYIDINFANQLYASYN